MENKTPAPVKKRFYNTAEIQELFGIGRNKALALMKTEGFPSVKLGNVWLVDTEKLDEWISKCYGKTIELEE